MNVDPLVGKTFRIVDRTAGYCLRSYIILDIAHLEEEDQIIVLFNNGTIESFDVNYIVWEGDKEFGTSSA